MYHSTSSTEEDRCKEPKLRYGARVFNINFKCSTSTASNVRLRSTASLTSPSSVLWPVGVCARWRSTAAFFARQVHCAEAVILLGSCCSVHRAELENCHPCCHPSTRDLGCPRSREKRTIRVNELDLEWVYNTSYYARHQKITQHVSHYAETTHTSLLRARPGKPIFSVRHPDGRLETTTHTNNTVYSSSVLNAEEAMCKKNPICDSAPRVGSRRHVGARSRRIEAPLPYLRCAWLGHAHSRRNVSRLTLITSVVQFEHPRMKTRSEQVRTVYAGGEAGARDGENDMAASGRALAHAIHNGHSRVEFVHERHVHVGPVARHRLSPHVNRDADAVGAEVRDTVSDWAWAVRQVLGILVGSDHSE